MLDNLKNALQNKNVMIDFLIATMFILIVVYGFYLHINNSVSTDDFLKEVTVYDELNKTLASGIDFKDFDQRVYDVFGQKKDIRNEIIFKGTKGRVNPFSISNK